MLIKSIIIENFRGFSNRQYIDLTDFTAFVGKNDVGKSTILEALDVFFNEGMNIIQLDKQDVNVYSKELSKGESVDIVIGVSFKDTPSYVILDENNKTSLSDEYLLDNNGNLTILKRYPNGGKPKVFIYANHPTQEDCKELLQKKQNELRKLSEKLECDKNKNAEMRKAIRQAHSDELNLQMQEIDVSKEDAKNIWEKLKTYLPIYSLFQADRSNEDKDKEIQDPLKEAVKQIFNSSELKDSCQHIYNSVIEKLQEVSDLTLAKIREMNPELANSLNPTLPNSEQLKWIDVFKSVSITSDNDIPLNKRGSGVKRMVLLNFFRAQAEQLRHSKNDTGIIYAIEEPETAQHIDHQNMLVDSLMNIANIQNSQVIITTHSCDILKSLDRNMIRLITNKGLQKEVATPKAKHLPYVSLNEINYDIFNNASVEFHNELYGYLQEIATNENHINSKEKEFDNWLVSKGAEKCKKWERQYKGKNTHSYETTLQTYVRNCIHHPENTHNIKFTLEELQISIEWMVQYIDSITTISANNN